MMDDTARFDVDNESSSKDKTVGSTNLLVLKGVQESKTSDLYVIEFVKSFGELQYVLNRPLNELFLLSRVEVPHKPSISGRRL